MHWDPSKPCAKADLDASFFHHMTDRSIELAAADVIRLQPNDEFPATACPNHAGKS